MDCGTRERDMGWRSFFLASVSLVFPFSFPLFCFHSRQRQTGCDAWLLALYHDLEWERLLATLCDIHGRSGDDVKSPRNDKKQSSQFQYLASCASNSPHLVYSIPYLPETILEGRHKKTRGTSDVNDRRLVQGTGQRINEIRTWSL